MISKNDKIEPGKFKLQSAARPPLSAGNYKVKTELLITEVDGGNDVKYENENLKFVVTAPRLSIEPSLIYGVYPSAGSSGAYHSSLPHIVFTRKTLPWERKIDSEANPKPWFALLLLTADEIKNNKIIIENIKAGNLKEGVDIIVPDIKLEEWETTNNDKKEININVIEMPVAFYNRISPKSEELRFLAHTRQVDMSDKEDTGIDQKGWFSVLVGNRLPQPDQDHSVCLVSLEGLPAVPVIDPKPKIRLVLLKQWSFNDSGATFEELAEQLLENISPFRIKLEGLTNDKPDQPVHEIVQKALNYGYMPIPHQLRSGDTTTSWYRGPLVPVDIAYPQLYKYRSADQTLRFDPLTGIFDISYAAAWQLGRLMALKSPGYYKALSNWQASFQKDKNLMAAEAVLTENKIDVGKLSEMIHTAESDEILTDLLIELWNNHK
jgi:hypothetical protein